MEDDIAVELKEKMDKSIAAFKKELSTLRAGRANPNILERIMVDYYGTPTPINQVGNISSPEPRMLVISLWDASMMRNVEKAIQKSDLGINPSNDGKVIRLVFPELTEERRKELVKTVLKRAENAKVAVRTIRREANEGIQKSLKAKEITEDDAKSMEKDTQKTTDECIKEIDKIAGDKQKEIMEV